MLQEFSEMQKIQEIEKLKKEGPAADYLNKFKANDKLNYEAAIKTNNFGQVICTIIFTTEMTFTVSSSVKLYERIGLLMQ